MVKNEIKQNEPKYLVIPAAGLGTRMCDVSPEVPKELLPVGDKPAIQYAVEEGVSAGIKNIIIIISKQKEIIRQYFEDSAFSNKLFPDAVQTLEKIRKKCSFTFLYQKEPSGESDAISYAKNIVVNHSIAIIYPDNIYFPAPGVLKILKQVYKDHKKDVIALMAVTKDNAPGLSNSGRVDVAPLSNDLFQIENFLQKSEGYFVPRFKGELRTCGISIFYPYLFEYIEKARATTKEVEFTDGPVLKLMLKDKDILGCLLPGTVFDIGNPKGYEQCLKIVRNKNYINKSIHRKIKI